MKVCPECGLNTEADVCPEDGRVTLSKTVLEQSDPFLGVVVAEKYEVLEQIGKGGMGTVYKCRHQGTGGFMALKFLRSDITDAAEGIKRFHLEAQNAAALNHPNIVKVSDFGVHETTVYLAMEYLVGSALSDVLERSGRLSPDRAVHIAVQVLKALWAAHEHPRKIIHRDIKPENIFLVTEVGHQDFVKVLDFGIARSLEGTRVGTKGLIGTPRYMAPEQWRGDPVDPRTDLYSVGCMLYEMLSGRGPFQSKGSGEARITDLARAHLKESPPPLISNSPDTTPNILLDLVANLLEKDASARPSSAREVIGRLENLNRMAFVTDETISTQPDVLAAEDFSGEAPPRRKTQRWMGIAITLAGIMFLVWGFWPGSGFFVPRDADDRVESNRSTEVGETDEMPRTRGEDNPTEDDLPLAIESDQSPPTHAGEGLVREGPASQSEIPILEPILSITSIPSGAEIQWVEKAQVLGVTPLDWRLPSNTNEVPAVTLKLSKKGFFDAEKKLEPHYWEDAEAELSISLKRRKPTRRNSKDSGKHPYGGF